jgi:hypothetical protein
MDEKEMVMMQSVVYINFMIFFDPSIHSFPLCSKEHSGRTGGVYNFCVLLSSAHPECFLSSKKISKDQGEREENKTIFSIGALY